MSTPTLAYERTTVEEFRTELQTLGIRVSTTVAWDVLRTTGHHGVALDAMLMNPRPDWLRRITGSPRDADA